MKAFCNKLLGLVATMAITLPFVLTVNVGAATTITVPNCTTKAATAAKLVTKSTTYESKNAVAGDQITVTFTQGVTTASTICITSGTKSVAAGVKPLIAETNIPADVPVTLAYNGTEYRIMEQFALLESLSGNGTKGIPAGTNFIRITGLYATATRVDDYGDSATATAAATVQLLDGEGREIARYTGSASRSSVTIQNLGTNYPDAKSILITGKSSTALTAGDRLPATASAQPTCACYTVSGLCPTVNNSNLTNLKLLEGQDANLQAIATNTTYYQWQKWNGAGTSFRTKYSPVTEDGCTLVSDWGDDTGITDDNSPATGWTKVLEGTSEQESATFAYTFTSQASDDDTYYRLVLKNDAGITISNPSKINVSPASFKSVRAYLSGAESLPIGDTLKTSGYGALLIYNNGDGVGDNGKVLGTHFIKYLKGAPAPLNVLDGLAGDLTVRYSPDIYSDVIIKSGVNRISVSGSNVILDGATTVPKECVYAVYTDSVKINNFENAYTVGIFNDGNKQTGYNVQVDKNTLAVGDYVRFSYAAPDSSKTSGVISSINKSGNDLISYVVKPDDGSSETVTVTASSITACDFCKYCTLSIEGRDAHAPQILPLVKNANGTAPEPESLRQGIDTAKINVTITDDIVEAALKPASQWIQYKVNNGAWTSYSGPVNIEVTSNGYYTIYAKDGANNQTSKAVVVDAFMKTPQSVQFGSDMEGAVFTQPAGTIVDNTSLLNAGSVYVQFAGEDDYSQLSASANATKYQFTIKFSDAEDGTFAESHQFQFGEHTVYAGVFNQSGDLLSDVCELTFAGTDTIVDPASSAENVATAIVGSNATMKAAAVNNATYQWYFKTAEAADFTPIADVTAGNITCNGGTDRVLTLYSVNADVAGYSFKCAINGVLGDQRTIMMIDPQNSNAHSLVATLDGEKRAYDDLWSYNEDLNNYNKASDFTVTMTFSNGTPNRKLTATPDLRLIEDNGLSVAQIKDKLAGISNAGDGSELSTYTVYVYTDGAGKEYYYTADDIDHTRSNAEGTEVYGYVKDANGTFLKVKERQMYTYYTFGTPESDLGTKESCGAVTSFNIKDKIKPNGLDLGDNYVKLILIDWKNIANSLILSVPVPTAMPDLYEVTGLSVSTDQWTNEDVVVSVKNINARQKNEAGSHKWNDNEWTNADTFTVEQNGTVKLQWRNKYNTQAGKPNEILTLDITNIDKTKPSLNIIVKDATAVTLKAKDLDSKVAAIYVDSDKLQGQTKLYTGDGNEEEVALDYRAVVNGTYTFTVVDVAGNTVTGKKKIAPEAYTVTGLNVSEKEWTNQNVLITVNSKNTILAPATPHNWNGGGWVTSKTYTAESNGTVVLRWQYAKGDDLVEGEPFSVNVTNIDKTLPSIELTANGATVNIQAKDSDSGISRIYVRGPGLAGLTNLATGNGRSSKLKASYTATKNGAFTFIAYDVAGNMIEKEYVIKDVPEETASAAEPEERVSYVYRDRYLTVPGTSKTVNTATSKTATNDSKKKDTSADSSIEKETNETEGSKKVFTVNSAMYRNLGNDGSYIVKGNGSNTKELETLGVSAEADTFRPISEKNFFSEFMRSTWPWILLVLCVCAGVVIGFVLYRRNKENNGRKDDTK